MKSKIQSEKYKQLEKRTCDFAHRAVKLAVTLEGTRVGNHICGQLTRCATSVAANYRACNLSQSKAGFRAKLSIVLEEVDESLFWIKFALDENMVKAAKVNDIIKEANELRAIYSSRKTLSTKAKCD